jgi:hypothetical protein
MKTIRQFVAAIAFALGGFVSPAWSSSYSPDQSDLWWIPGESGWGIQLVQRNSTIFATMFVYDASGAATWYVATMSANGLNWTGDLYATRGPWFGAVPFDPASVAVMKAGTMNWSPTGVNAGTLSYTVNGTQVTKSLQREFIALDDYSGNYVGGLHQENTGCSDPTQNGATEVPAVVVISQTGNAIDVATGDVNFNICEYTGALSQDGQMGSIVGTFNCSSGDHGTFTMSELQVNPLGITSRFTANAMLSRCAETGWFGAARLTTF